jgi:hypothetical protein
MVDPITNFTSRTFAEQLHTTFNVGLADGSSIPLELTAVNEPAAPREVEMFSVHFRGPRAPRLAQQIHRFQHEKLGGFDLFITAIAGDDQSTTYEAVFHRLRKKKP